LTSTGRRNAGLRLIADIGGTNARFALLDASTHWREERVFACADYPDLVTAVEHYLESVGANEPGRRPLEAAMAIAGPITGDVITMTNHVWQFSAAQTRRLLRLERLKFLNDFTALALGVRHLPGNELDKIGGGRPAANAPIAVIGPGTGLGVSGLIPAGEHWLALQGEGGHVTLSVMNEHESAVLHQLYQRFSHVSAERVLSGPGLVNLYDALCSVEGVVPEVLTPPDITRRARDGSCRICLATVNMFCSFLGTVASNLVLTLGALGGAYIGGGIVPSLGAFFASSPFRSRFEDKGRYAHYLAAVPTFVIQTSLPAFVGLANAFDAPYTGWDAQ
jgi:glucokinase